MVTYFVTGSPGNRKRSLAQTLESNAREFIAAASALDSKTVWVKYFLLFHAIEIGLKAALAQRGYDEPKLKKLGHDLAGILKCVEREGIDLSKHEKRVFSEFQFVGGETNRGGKAASEVFRFDHYGSVRCPDIEPLTAAVTGFISRLDASTSQQKSRAGI